MNPDIELDAAVAKAIGRSCLPHSWERTDECMPEGCVYRCRNCFENVLSDGPPVVEIKTCVPPYSTDNNAALAAAEKFHAVELSRHHQAYGGKWVADLAWKSDESTIHWISGGPAETPAHAICLAILKTKEKL